MAVYAHERVTPKESDSLVLLPSLKVVKFTFASLNASNKFAVPIEAGTHVLGVFLNVTTAFDAASTVDVGDGTTADGFLDGVLADAIGMSSSLSSTEAFQAGKFYAAAGRVVATFSEAEAAGAGELRILMVTKEGLHGVA